MDYKERFEYWTKNVADSELKALLLKMKDDENAVKNAFYKELEFGTGGLRGEIGAGTNCLNVLTIAKVTQGIADNMKSKGQTTAAISYDSRIKSDAFAKTAAAVFASNGIRVYITAELMPTPFLSFLTRTVKADVGVMITASHNPARYNGYKVYGADGCQLTDGAAREMIGFINGVDPFKVKSDGYDALVKSGMITVADPSVERAYTAAVRERSLGSADGLSVAYSPLNGAGYRLVPQILRESGVRDIYIVKEQGTPDGNFTTCPYPNPEKRAALELGLKLAEQRGADLLIATDPDADRMGVAVKTGDGYKLLSGNETGVLLTDYIFAARKKAGTLPAKPVLVKTIVTTDLAVKIAEQYGAEVFDVLTGFKYIGDVIGRLEKNGEADRFVLGFEESYGYLSGSYVRDKDAVVAAMLTAQMAAHYKRAGKTLADRLGELYKEFGYYEHRLISFEFPGADGSAKMARLLKELRAAPPGSLAGEPVTRSVDYLNKPEPDLPPSDVLRFITDSGTSLVVRPSGTEPLIKTYLTACKTPAENTLVFEKLTAYLNKIFD
ncbi:MAG: phospho-sugar mutase [Clostridiales bacterium]|jgi:phosphoglucomutase|nr:phospho-sugar mutase [Clostridiales bacterium]